MLPLKHRVGLERVKEDLMAHYNKWYYIARSIVLCILILFLFGCAFEEIKPPVYFTSPNYDKTQYQRVGIIVNRMGNIQDNTGYITPADLDTDYSIRTSIPYEYDSKNGPRDVYIGSIERIKESLPNYPEYEPESRFKYIRYYKDITQQIYENISRTLTQKGYSVIDFSKAEKEWEKPVSEMKIRTILEKLKGDVDALLVMHYMDRGSYLWDSIALRTEFSGFTQLKYTISMFDVASMERVIFLEYEEVSPFQAITGDPEIQSDQKLKTKALRAGNTYHLDLNEDEIINLVMKYMRQGLVYNHYYDARDYNTVTIRGLYELIP